MLQVPTNNIFELQQLTIKSKIITVAYLIIFKFELKRIIQKNHFNQENIFLDFSITDIRFQKKNLRISNTK